MVCGLATGAATVRMLQGRTAAVTGAIRIFRRKAAARSGG